MPLYVLLSGQSASAAEAFAYTLQSQGRAMIIGERSAGAANPGLMFDVGQGFVILVPLDTPVDAVTGTNWEGVGVRPDLGIEPESALTRAQIVALREILRIGLSTVEERDARWALEALASERIADGASLQDFAGSYGNRKVRVEDGELLVQRSRWPARRLHPLDHGAFVVDGTPWHRVAFERRNDQVVAMIESTSGGGETRWQRQDQ